MIVANGLRGIRTPTFGELVFGHVQVCQQQMRNPPLGSGVLASGGLGAERRDNVWNL